MEIEPKYADFIAIEPWVQINLEIPSPASRELPDWYKDTTPFPNGHKFEISEQGKSQATVKNCMPILDILSTGWIQKTWCDIYIQINSRGDVKVDHAYGPEIVDFRGIESIGKMPIPTGHVPISLLWKRPWRLRTPIGHSVLYTHPFYRNDLPFTSVSAVVDTDNYHSAGTVPFFLKEGFSGLIPKGTPMYQIIPFKKDSWVARKEELTDEFNIQMQQEEYTIFSSYSGGYKKEFWNKPDFSNDQSECPVDHSKIIKEENN